jgi:hypothetical protein
MDESGDPKLTPTRRRQRRRLLVVGNAVVLVILIAGAIVLWQTRPHYLDTGVVARTVAGKLHAKVSCPDKARRSAGTRFTCSVVYVDGHHGSVVVTVINDAGDYRWKTSTPKP